MSKWWLLISVKCISASPKGGWLNYEIFFYIFDNFWIYRFLQIPLYGFSGRSKVDISGVQKDINQRMIISLTASSVQTLFTLSNSGMFFKKFFLGIQCLPVIKGNLDQDGRPHPTPNKESKS